MWNLFDFVVVLLSVSLTILDILSMEYACGYSLRPYPEYSRANFYPWSPFPTLVALVSLTILDILSMEYACGYYPDSCVRVRVVGRALRDCLP